MPDRATMIRAAGAIAGVAVLALLFIFSYAQALHRPQPHDVPVAVTSGVPPEVRQQLGAGGALDVQVVADEAAALQRIDERRSYGAVIATTRGVTVVVAPAASAAIADFLQTTVAQQLRRSGTPVTIRTVHRLPATDARGLVGFYLAVGWAIAGYLGATLLGLVFGTGPDRRRTVWRGIALGALGLLVGLGGAAIATSIAGYDHGFGWLVVLGLLTVLATGGVTVALQTLFGIIGTGLAILIFVVFGNPAAGGAYAGELLPGLWRVLGPYIPTGAATTGVRDAAYFPDASLAGPLLVLLAWAVVGAAVALVFAGRGRGMSDAETRASLAGVG